jgi:cytochrome c
MKRILVAVAAIAALASNAALASEQLAKEKNCLACHAIDNKVVGPGYKEVAAKYKGDKSAEAKLATKIQKGGGGVWGQIPMPANPQVSEETGTVDSVAQVIAPDLHAKALPMGALFICGFRVFRSTRLRRLTTSQRTTAICERLLAS